MVLGRDWADWAGKWRAKLSEQSPATDDETGLMAWGGKLAGNLSSADPVLLMELLEGVCEADMGPLSDSARARRAGRPGSENKNRGPPRIPLAVGEEERCNGKQG